MSEKVNYFNNKDITKSLIIGSSESGKTHCYTNQILSNPDSTTSYIVLDVNNTLYNSNKETLEHEGYNIKVLDLCNIDKSIKYNPFNMVKDYTDIEHMADAYYNRVFLNEDNNDIFWNRCEKEFVYQQHLI